MHWFRAKRFQDITIEDIESLVAAKTEESTHLEYKRLLLDSRDPTLRPEMGKDVSAFANTEGGDLIFGVAANKDDLSLEGLTGPRDGTQRRIEDLIRENIEPRVRFEIKTLPTGEDRFVVLVRVPRSLDAPHRNNGGKQNQFWRRGASGAHVMTSSQIRETVLQSRDVNERAMAWRDQRLGMYEHNEAPVRLDSGPRLYIHGFPVGLSDEALPLHTTTASLLRDASPIPFRIRRDFHGAYLHDGTETSTPKRLEAWMNTGAFEVAWNLLVSTAGDDSVTSGRKLETWIQEKTAKHIAVIESETGPTAWLVMITLSKVKDLVLQYSEDERYDRFDWIDTGKPAFTSPEIHCAPLHITEHPADTAGWADALKPAFDRIAQAANRPGSPDWRCKP